MFAIAEFGSAIRGGTDSHSDRDLLIVSRRRVHRALRARYEQCGYSVCALTPGQIASMQRRGSLFIQHLKLESRILCDADDRFRNWLGQCDLVFPTHAEIWRCKATVSYFSGWPNDTRLLGWKADALYCVSRDFLIKWLAASGCLAFGLDDIARGLREKCPAFLGDLSALQELRESKAAYRARHTLPESTLHSIQKLIESLAGGFGVRPLKADRGHLEAYLQKLTMRRFSSNYERLRTLEAAYLIARKQGLYHPDHRLLMKHIMSPNGYGSSQKRKHAYIAQYLSEVLELMANKQLNRVTLPG